MEEERAKQYLLRILARRSYLSAECRGKLQKKGFSSSVIEKVVSYCQEKGYLDDALYLERMISKEKRGGRSFLALKQKWMAKSRGDATLFAKASKEGFEKEALDRYLTKKKNQDALTDPQEKKKLIQRLLQRGFSWDVIEQSLRHDN